MAIKGLKGYGFTSINVVHPEVQVGDGGQAALFNGPISSFTVSAEDTEVESKGYPIGGTGLLENIYTYISERIWSLEVGFQAFDWGILQLLFGVYEKATTSIMFRKSYTGTVPLEAPFSITDSKLTGKTYTDVHVSFMASESQEWTSLLVKDATPSAGQVQVTGTTLVFNEADAGKSFSYQINEAYSNVKTLGVESNAISLDSVSFSGEIIMQSKPSSIGIDVPSMGKTGGLSLQVGEENTVTFKPTASGSNVSAVRFIKLPA